MKKSYLFIFLLVFKVHAQEKPTIQLQDIQRIETELASDKMEGREIFTQGIALASTFIEGEFKKINLSYYNGLTNYRQEFIKLGKDANNVIGVIPGKSKANEYVVFSAHYDHLGIEDRGADKVYNGANDDASGTTAIIALAKYFKELNQNERTLIFVAFTGEEVGGFGSKYFSQSIDPEKVVAMFNIEMIGKPSKWGENSAFITGFERSDFGTILQKNLQGTPFTFYPDPYPEQNLFYRSDNATLARLGVPAHAISTDQISIVRTVKKILFRVWVRVKSKGCSL